MAKAKNAPPPSAADGAYVQVREICLRFPSAEEKISHGAPSFHVRGKMFLMFVDDHHHDGRVAVWCRSTFEEQRSYVANDPIRFFVPPYVGVKGWLGMIVAPGPTDWIELSILVERGWTSVAPPRVLREGRMPAAKPLPPSPRMSTDSSVASAAFARLSQMALAFPGATCERESGHATFRVGRKVFAYFLDNHHGDGKLAACFRGDPKEHARLISAEPKRYFLPAYIGSRGYLAIRVDGPRVRWTEIGRRFTAAYERVAPKRRRLAT